MLVSFALQNELVIYRVMIDGWFSNALVDLMGSIH